MYLRLIYLEEIIEIWDTWKNLMGLQGRVFKNCSKWTLARKNYYILNTPIEKQSKKDWKILQQFKKQ